MYPNAWGTCLCLRQCDCPEAAHARSLAPGATEAKANVLSCPDLLLLGLQYRLDESLTGFMARAPL